MTVRQTLLVELKDQALRVLGFVGELSSSNWEGLQKVLSLFVQALLVTIGELIEMEATAEAATIERVEKVKAIREEVQGLTELLSGGRLIEARQILVEQVNVLRELTAGDPLAKSLLLLATMASWRAEDFVDGAGKSQGQKAKDQLDLWLKEHDDNHKPEQG